MNDKGLSNFEKNGGTYFEVDGILYPNISFETKVSIGEVGKYGLIWLEYMKANHYGEYLCLSCKGTLYEKAKEINEESHEMLQSITDRWLASHKPKDIRSTMEMWRLREEAKRIAEEEIYAEIIYAGKEVNEDALL